MKSWIPTATAMLAIMLALPLAGASAAHSSARGRVSSAALLGGVNVTGVGPLPLRRADEAINQAKLVHADVVRTEVPWSAVEPTAPNVIDPATLAFMDRIVNDASADGIRVIFSADSSPCWASAAPPALRQACRSDRSSRANGWPPARPSDYAAFVSYLAQRYGNKLAAIEVWNEPDQANELYFAGPHKAARYAALLRAAYPAIKLANPQVPVIAGSLVGSNGAFLRALYAAGIKGFYDGLAVHFYNLTIASLQSIHEVQVANNDLKPLWLDEFGWSSCWPRYHTQQEQGCVTRRIQAANITSVFRELSQMPYVAAAVIYKMQGSTQEDFGMLTASGGRKPAFAALAAVLANPVGPLSPSTLRLGVSGGRTVAVGSAPVGDFMELEATAGAVLRYRAFFVLNRFNEYRIALPAVLGTSGLTVRVYQYSRGPASAAQRSL